MYLTVRKMTRSSILKATNLLDINNSNEVHKWITNQQDVSRATGQLLYKIIVNKDEIYLYIQSHDKFNLDNIDQVGLMFVKTFTIDTLQNTSYIFDVQVFPHVTKNGKKMFITNLNDRFTWLKNQFAKNGITLLECDEYKRANVNVKTKHIITTYYRGRIKVDDSEKAFMLLSQGLGRLKNYGCGLILMK